MIVKAHMHPLHNGRAISAVGVTGDPLAEVPPDRGETEAIEEAKKRRLEEEERRRHEQEQKKA